MTASSCAALLAYIFAVGYTPGPANLYALSCTFKYGRRAALRMWWGLVAGFSVALWVVAACCGASGRRLDRFFAPGGGTLTVTRGVGGLTLIFR